MQIPDGVTFNVSGSLVKAKGPAGESEKKLPKKVQVTVNGKDIEVVSENRALMNTYYAHIANMLKGSKEGFTVKMKIIFAHFPITMEVKGKDIMIKNFVGEKVPRKTKVVGNTKVEAKGQEVTITGPDKDAVGQTVANIRMATRTRNRDHRVFQDGLYIVG